MKIESKDWDVSSLLSGRYFKIPRYQRPYSWERLHLEEFWQDTIQHRNSGDDYFIGSVVVYKHDNMYSIVDGQQRLTTITVMLCVIRDTFEQEGLGDLASGVHTLIERRNIANELQYALSTESSYPYFQEYIQKRAAPDIELTPGPEERALAAAEEYFKGEIATIVDSIKSDRSLDEKKRTAQIKKRLEAIRDELLGLQCIFVELDDEDDAYLVFES